MEQERQYPTSAQLRAVVRQMRKGGLTFSDAITEFRKQFILTVLRDVRWNQTKAARALHIHRNTLRRTLRSLALDARLLRKAERRPTDSVREDKAQRIAGLRKPG